MQAIMHKIAGLCVFAMLAACGADGAPSRPGEEGPAQTRVFEQDSLRRGVVLGN